jgi:hypothetical protein
MIMMVCLKKILYDLKNDVQWILYFTYQQVPKLKADTRNTSLSKDVPTSSVESHVTTANTANALTKASANVADGASGERSFSLMNSLLNLSHSAVSVSTDSNHDKQKC